MEQRCCQMLGKNGGKVLYLLGDGPVYYSDTVHSYAYPFALTGVDSVSANLVSEAGCVVPVVLSVNGSVRISFIRLYGSSDAVTGYYTFTVMGRWK